MRWRTDRSGSELCASRTVEVPGIGAEPGERQRVIAALGGQEKYCHEFDTLVLLHDAVVTCVGRVIGAWSTECYSFKVSQGVVGRFVGPALDPVGQPPPVGCLPEKLTQDEAWAWAIIAAGGAGPAAGGYRGPSQTGLPCSVSPMRLPR